MEVVDITTLKLTTGPAVFLFLGGLSVFCVHITENLVAAMQHFAAGIVVCAISMELMPPILEARGDLSVVTTITVGFFLGVFCVFIFDSLCETEDETDESEEFYGLRDSSRRGYGTVSGFERDGKGVLSVLSSRRRSGKASLARQTSAIDVVYPFPYSLVFAVCIDALVDGLLIGKPLSFATIIKINKRFRSVDNSRAKGRADSRHCTYRGNVSIEHYRTKSSEDNFS